MAIVFSQQKKRQKYLLLIVLLIIILIWVVVRKGFLVRPSVPINVPKPPEVKINFPVLDHPVLGELQFFKEIELPEAEEEVGRENPFAPYSKP